MYFNIQVGLKTSRGRTSNAGFKGVNHKVQAVIDNLPMGGVIDNLPTIVGVVEVAHLIDTGRGLIASTRQDLEMVGVSNPVELKWTTEKV